MTQDELVLETLAAGRTYAEASSAVGISERTIVRRMSDAGFAAEVGRRRAVWAADIVGQLTGMAPAALSVIREVLADGTFTEKLRAAQLTLSLGSALRRDGDLGLRVAVVEQRQQRREEAGTE